MSQTDDALAVSLLCSRLLPDDAAPLTGRDVCSLRQSGVPLGPLLTHVPADLPGRLTTERLEGRMALRRTWGLIAEQLDAKGIRVLTVEDHDYPDALRSRLGPAAPALLYVAGDPSLLASPGIGIVGSRDIDEDGADATRQVAEEAVRLGRPVVSGAARGVDRLAMDAAFQHGGAVVAFPADSMGRLLRQAEVRRGVLDGQVALATPYNPDARFTVGNAMGRNKLIYAQAALTVVIATADGSGGTWEGATEALTKGYGRVAVWTGPGAGPGNEKLIDGGAAPLAAAADLEQVCQPPSTDAQQSMPEQLGLAV
ncbi:MAG TPA: DNA-processing protein DprA [Euzebya sp.]|nr:DNA-processing protein DprA [Euzebya sp.]